ncbi:MAG TPA: alkaline phosphatase family protein [Solirubrobacteraceae bacterium]|nr:alkaline phosphatase family protein [Solirubrobacteraceae bacterium]
MSDFLEQAERAALRGAAHLLPAKWRKIIELIDAPVPATPTATVDAPTGAEAERLSAIDHIVVVMLENRSFDHMLGFLSLPAQLGGRERGDVDGLTSPEVNVNSHDGTSYPIEHLAQTAFEGEAEDPDHSGHSVDEQLEGADPANGRGGTGFVKNFARISQARAHKLGVPLPSPGLVMGYYDADDLPVYDHLASEYCVVDRWFSSVPGATWPNRLYAAAGRAAGSRDDIAPPLYSLPSFPRYLDQHGVDWRWYSFDPATLRAIDPEYRFSNHHRFSFLDTRKLSTRERAAGELTEEGPSFLDDVAKGELPAVSWIDPRFKDLRVLGPNSNDDHPPSDVIAGQDLILTIYHALASAPTWSKTLLIVTYDEHGGFYDHVAPPAAIDDDHRFQRLGVRVPALLISPHVKAGSSSMGLLSKEMHFDHTSIIKTILTRFCNEGGRIPAISARVAAAEHLGHLLSDSPQGAVADYSPVAAKMTAWHEQWAAARYADPVATGGPPVGLTDFQTGFYEMARALRRAGLPGGHP